MVIYLGVDSQIRVLCWNGEQQPKPAAGKEAGRMFYIGINSIRGHTQVGDYLKATGCRISYTKQAPIIFPFLLCSGWSHKTYSCAGFLHMLGSRQMLIEHIHGS